MAAPDSNAELLAGRRITIAQTYPYEANLGGDAAYVQAFARYLAAQGALVDVLVTDMAHDRAMPFYRNRYSSSSYLSYQVRKAIELPGDIRVSAGLSSYRLHAQAAMVKMGWMPPPDRSARLEFSGEEIAWLQQKVDAISPDVLVLFHDAARLAPAIKARGRIFALVGHIASRQIRAGSAGVHSPAAGIGETHTEPDFSHLRKAHCCGLNSYDDLKFFRSVVGIEPSIFLGMGYPQRPALPPSTEPIVLFVGNATDSNRKALAWFLDHSWPLVVKSVPQARMRIVGRAAQCPEFAGAESLDLVGPVSELDQEYVRAAVVIAPLLEGSAGVKIKVAEAMSFGRPLVTTTVGVDPQNRHQLDAGAIVTDDAEGFADAVSELLADEKLRRARARGARDCYEQLFSERASYGEFMEWYRS